MTNIITQENAQQVIDFYELEKKYTVAEEKVSPFLTLLEKRLKSITDGNRRVLINTIVEFYEVPETEYDNNVLVNNNIQKQIISDMQLSNTKWYVIAELGFDEYTSTPMKYYVCNHLLENDTFLSTYITTLKNNFKNKLVEYNNTQEKVHRRNEVNKLKELFEKYGDTSKYFDAQGNYIDEDGQAFNMPHFNIPDNLPDSLEHIHILSTSIKKLEK